MRLTACKNRKKLSITGLWNGKIQSPLCPESSKRSDKEACSLPEEQGIVAGLPSQVSDKGEVSLSRASVRNVLSGRSGAYSPPPSPRSPARYGPAYPHRNGEPPVRGRHRDTSVPFLMDRLNTGRPAASGTYRFGPKKTPYMPDGHIRSFLWFSQRLLLTA